MKCPYCGSDKVIWDYANGCLVCSECGSVIDQIYSSETYYDIEDENTLIPNFLYSDLAKKIENADKFQKELSNDNLRKFIIYNGSIVRESSLNSLKLIENNEKLLLLYDIVDSLPKFKSKSIKYKLALALYFYDKKEFEKISKNLNISDKYMKKIISKINTKTRLKIQSLLKRKIESLECTP